MALRPTHNDEKRRIGAGSVQDAILRADWQSALGASEPEA